MSAVVSLVYILQRIPEQIEKEPTRTVVRNVHHKLDFIGFALFTPATVMFLLGMSWGGTKYPWSSATIIGLLVAAPIAAALFGVWIHHYQDKSLIPPKILKKPVVMYGCIMSGLQGGAFLMLQYYLPLWFQSIKGVSPQTGGVMMLPNALTQIISGISCSFLRRYKQTRLRQVADNMQSRSSLTRRYGASLVVRL